MSKSLGFLTWLNLSCANSHKTTTNDDNLTKLLAFGEQVQEDSQAEGSQGQVSPEQGLFGGDLVLMMEKRMRSSSYKSRLSFLEAVDSGMVDEDAHTRLQALFATSAWYRRVALQVCLTFNLNPDEITNDYQRECTETIHAARTEPASTSRDSQYELTMLYPVLRSTLYWMLRISVKMSTAMQLKCHLLDSALGLFQG